MRPLEKNYILSPKLSVFFTTTFSVALLQEKEFTHQRELIPSNEVRRESF